MKIAFLIDNLGPYHVARMMALSERTNLLVLELYRKSADYAWISPLQVPFSRATLFDAESHDRSGSEIFSAVKSALNFFSPDVVFVPGWACAQSVAAVFWAQSVGVPVVVMSDSQEVDFERSAIKEWVKRRFVACCAAGFVAGSPHKDYLVKLGMNPDSIASGYDVVDNNHFDISAPSALVGDLPGRQQYQLPDKYFLASARFIEKKNLEFLVKAYKVFLEKQCCRDLSVPHLVILGDGPLRFRIEQLIVDLGLLDFVHLRGFIQYPDLPIYYGFAHAFVLASTTEQWGLVVNEAMASGLPVLVSDRCGCVVDLVSHGVNGYVFNPFDIQGLAGYMDRIACSDDLRRSMGRASLAKVRDWSPELFAQNALKLASIVLKKPLVKQSWINRLLLRLMLRIRFATGG